LRGRGLSRRGVRSVHHGQSDKKRLLGPGFDAAHRYWAGRGGRPHGIARVARRAHRGPGAFRRD
jgi:hypothetical protein